MIANKDAYPIVRMMDSSDFTDLSSPGWDPSSLNSRLVAEHERGLHRTPVLGCPLCRKRPKRVRPCRLGQVQSAVMTVVREIEQGVRDGWVNEDLWEAKEMLEDAAGLAANPRSLDTDSQILVRRRLIELQRNYNLIVAFCDADDPAANQSFWDSLGALREALSRGPEVDH